MDDNSDDDMPALIQTSSKTPPPYRAPATQPQSQQKSALKHTSQQESEKDPNMLSVSGKQKCSHCTKELGIYPYNCCMYIVDYLGKGAAMIIESLSLFYHLSCFRCYVC